MVSKKKALLLILTLTFILIASVTGMVLVLVSSAMQTAESVVNVRYHSSDVHVEIAASVTVGESTTAFTEDATPSGLTTIELKPDIMTGVLSQPNNANSINLTRDNSKAVFMYSFKNLDDDADVKIVLKKIPTNTNGEKNYNLNISYAYSDTLSSDLSSIVGSDDTYTYQVLPAYLDEYPTMYIYIIAEVDNKLDPADLMGSFEWELTRAESSEVATYTIDMTGVEMVERTTTNYVVSSSIPSTMTYKTKAGSTDIDIDLVPAKSNGVFLGYSTSSSSTTPDAILMPKVAGDDNRNIIAAASSKTIYPIFVTGTVPASSYTYSNGSYIVSNTKITASIPHFVVPDYYNDGTHGFAKVTAITDGTSNANGVMNSNTSVTKITLGRYLTNLGKYSFYNCTNVTEVNYFPTNVTTSTLKNDTWYNVGKNSIGVVLNITSNVQAIPYGFITSSTTTNMMKLNEIRFEDSEVPLILQEYAFCYVQIDNIVLPDRVAHIKGHAFEASKIQSLHIPANVSKIGIYLTGSCQNLASITVSEDNQWYDSRENCNAIVETATNKIVAGCKDSTFPSTITTIGQYSFVSQYTRTGLTIPANIKVIEEKAFTTNNGITSLKIAKGVEIGANVFKNCTSISTFDVKASVIGDNAFEGCTKLTNITLYAKTIGFMAFYSCTGLTNVNFASGVEFIGSGAFQSCTKLSSVNLGPTVNQLEWVCFESTAITYLYIPSNVRYIGMNIGGQIIEIEFEQTGVTWLAENIYGYEPITFVSSKDFELNASYMNTDPIPSEYSMWEKQ